MVLASPGNQSVDAISNPPLWREALVGIDITRLQFSRTFYGIGVPRGDRKQSVVLIPGFFSTDSFSMPYLFQWLTLIGYTPYMSLIGINAKCFDTASNQLKSTIDRAVRETGRPTWLCGHSLGGILARSAASRWPEKVSGIVHLGSPFRNVSAHWLLLKVAEVVRDDIHRRQKEDEKNPDCFTQLCKCPTVTAFTEDDVPSGVRRAAIFTKNDGVVNWKDCIEEDPRFNYEVESLCHNSLVCSSSSFKVLSSIMRAWLLEDRSSA